MKKLFFCLLLLFILLNLSINVNAIKVDRDITEINGNLYDTSGLLYGIDAVKSDGSGINTEAKFSVPILNKTFIENEFKNNVYVNTGTNGAGTTYTFFQSSRNFKEYCNEINANINVDNSISLGKKLFKGKLSNQLALATNLNLSESHYQYFYTHNQYSKLYDLTLQNVFNRDRLKENLSSEYKYVISQYYSGKITADHLFNEIGTHLLTAADYGGFISTDFIAATNSYKLDNDFEVYFTNEFNLALKDVKNIESRLSSSFNIKTNHELISEDTYLRIYFCGGASVGSTSLSDYSDAVDTWNKTLNSKTANLIKVNDMIPLWELLPKEYDNLANVQKLQNDFKVYADNNVVNENSYPMQSLNGKDFIRTYDLSSKISSSNMTQQSKSVFIDLKDICYDINTEIYNNDYRWVKAEIYCEAENNGVQTIYLYDKDTNNASSSINTLCGTVDGNCYLYGKKFELVKLIDRKELYLNLESSSQIKYSKFKLRLIFSKC